jgi:hypothetical protein
LAIKRSMILWRSATPLENAWLLHAPQDLREAHDRLTDWQTVLSDAPEIASETKFVDRLLSGVGAVARAHTAMKASENNLKRQLIQRIRSGEFELLGFRVLPTRSRNPVICKISRTEACERVREKLRAERYSVGQRGDGTSDQNIAKLILEICPPRKINKAN